MPTFVFKCDNCNSKFEALLPKPEPCLKCTCGNSAKRVFTIWAGTKYVGSGWAGIDEQTSKRLQEANHIAENMYEKRAEKASPKLSEQSDFWQDVAKAVGD